MTALPAAILEKSQKTLENIQKTVTVAADEIHKTIHENLTDLRSLESDMGRFSDSAGSPTSSVATVVENKMRGKAGATSTSGSESGAAGVSISRTATTEGPTSTAGTKKITHKNGSNGVMPVTPTQKSPLPPTQPIEADVSVLNTSMYAIDHATVAAAAAAAATTGAMAMSHGGAVDATVERVSERALSVSVMPEVDCDDANFQNYTYIGDGAADKTTERTKITLLDGEEHASAADASGNGRKGVGSDSGGGGGEVGGVGAKGDGITDDGIKRRSPDGQGGSAAGSG